MSSTAFALIVFSALMHALWNLLVKRSGDKTVFIWWMFVSSGGLLNLVLPLLPGAYPRPTLLVLVLAAAGGLCFVFYHLLNGRAYRDGDLSLTYPLAQTSMFWVPLWGVLWFGERLTLVGGCGILLILTGAWCIQLQRVSWGEIARPFQRLGEPSVQAALAAGFIYSLGALIDKTGVNHFSPLYFTHLLVMAMFAAFSVNLARRRYRGRVLAEWRRSRKLILLSGPIMMGSFLAFRYGLQLAPVSYAVPVRQVSLLIGVLIGALFLGESYGRLRFASAFIILAGAFLIRFG